MLKRVSGFSSSRTLLLLSVTALIGAFASAFYAGCVGDLKSMVRGNPASALAFESASLTLAAVALVLGAAALAFSPSRMSEGKVAVSFAVALISVPVCFFALIYTQQFGELACTR